jgi:hypothetical protein
VRFRAKLCVRSMRLGLHSELLRQDLRVGWLRWIVWDLQLWAELQLGWSVRLGLYSELLRQDLRVGWLRWIVRNLQLRAKLQLVGAMRFELHPELFG